jgi:hypothetical protein
VTGLSPALLTYRPLDLVKLRTKGAEQKIALLGRGLFIAFGRPRDSIGRRSAASRAARRVRASVVQDKGSISSGQRGLSLKPIFRKRRLRSMVGRFLLGGALLLVACSEAQPEIQVEAASDLPPESGLSDAADASRPGQGGLDAQADGFARFPSLISLLAKDRCLPGDPLPTLEASTMTSCRIVLIGVTAGCGEPGLSPAAPSDLAMLQALLKARRDASLPSGPACEVIQVAANCTYETSSGWCYVRGSCFADAGRTCTQAVCTTSGFDSLLGAFDDLGRLADYVEAWIICP